MTNDYGAGLADFFDAAWSSGDICSSVGYDPTEGSYDAATLAQSVVDAGCDSVVLMSYATDGASIVEELKGQGFGGAVFGADGIADAGFIDASNDSSTLDGIIATKPRPSSDSARKVLFDSAWTRTGGPEGAIYTHETFDAVLLIGLAVLSGDSDVADAVATTGTGFEGASGTHTFDSAGDVIGNGYEVCSFSYAGSAASFGCSQIWTTDSGLTNK
jgi:ABC-type branched-subunit amino acid transport system substrate-binding protein